MEDQFDGLKSLHTALIDSRRRMRKAKVSFRFFGR
jgi:hypothetical protein